MGCGSCSTGESNPPLQVMFISGQRDPRSCGLTTRQRAFLDAVGVPHELRVERNFPYDPTMPPLGPVPLAMSIVRHVRLFLAIRRPGWRHRHRAATIAQLERADHTLVLAGSIGLDLLGRMELPAAVLARTTIVAYGAVATRPPDHPVLRIVSRRDLLARWQRVDVAVDCGHLDYLEQPGTIATVQRVLAGLVAHARVRVPG